MTFCTVDKALYLLRALLYLGNQKKDVVQTQIKQNGCLHYRINQFIQSNHTVWDVFGIENATVKENQTEEIEAGHFWRVVIFLRQQYVLGTVEILSDIVFSVHY